MTSMALKKCANGGLKLKANGRLETCCDPCDIAIDQERERIMSLPTLSNFVEYGEGVLVANMYDSSANDYIERRYNCKAAFEFTIVVDGWPITTLEYFDCENCELHVLWSDYMTQNTYKFYAMPSICRGCIFKYKDATLLATIDEGGEGEDTTQGFIARAVWSYTNNSNMPQMVFYEEGGDVSPSGRNIDDYAQLVLNGQQPTDGKDIYYALVYPHDTVTLYSINEQRPLPIHPWEIHCKVYMAEITCDPCEVAIYKMLHENTEQITNRYGAGFYTGGGTNTPCKSAVTTFADYVVKLYGVTCDCEAVLLWSVSAFDQYTIPYTEDATACDGEGEVQ